MEVSNIFKINTNIKDDKGSYVSFCVLAKNPKNAMYVANECNYNGKPIEDKNIQSVVLTQQNIITSYYVDVVKNNDLNPNYVVPTDKEQDNK